MEIHAFFLFFLLLLLHYFTASLAVTERTNITTDQSALLALKTNITDDPYKVLAIWHAIGLPLSLFAIRFGSIVRCQTI